jgi:hypothetical protein
VEHRQTSTAPANFNTTVVGAALEAVTSGLFQGDTVLLDRTGPATQVLQCTLGLDAVSSICNAVSLEITSI